MNNEKMTKIKSPLDLNLAELIDSLGAVMIPMLLLMTAFMVEAAFMTFSILPAHVDHPFDFMISAFLGIAIGMVLLTTAVNKTILPAWMTDSRFDWVGFPLLFAGSSIVVSLFFFEVHFSLDRENMKKIFMSNLLGAMDFLFAYLFVKKFEQKRKQMNATELAEQLQHKVEQLESNLKQQASNTKQLRDNIEQQEIKIEQFKIQALKLWCEHCEQYMSPASIASHRTNCKKRQEKKALELKQV